MATISENLLTLKNAKDSIKSAIESKGQDLTNVPFTEYADKIDEIQTKPLFDLYGSWEIGLDFLGVPVTSYFTLYSDGTFDFLGQTDFFNPTNMQSSQVKGTYRVVNNIIYVTITYSTIEGTEYNKEFEYCTYDEVNKQLTLIADNEVHYTRRLGAEFLTEVAPSFLLGKWELTTTLNSGDEYITDTSDCYFYENNTVKFSLLGEESVLPYSYKDVMVYWNVSETDKFRFMFDTQEDVLLFTGVVSEGGETFIFDARMILKKVISTGESGGGDAVLTTKEITSNGTYNASDDGADGYSSVVVNVTSSGTDRLQWKCDNVKSMTSEFSGYQGESLDEALEGLDTSKVEVFRYTFNGCTWLKAISALDMSSAKDCYGTFYNCKHLETLPVLNISNATDLSYVFYNCTNLKTILFSDTSKAITLYNAFRDCYVLEYISPIDCSSSTNLSYVLYSAKVLPEVTINNTSLVTNFNQAFNQCQNLAIIHGTLDLIKADVVSQIIYNCKKLTTVNFKNIKISLQIGSGTSFGTLLTNASLLNTAQELWDNTDSALGGARTLTMSTPSKTAIQSIYVKLVDITDEMIANDEYISNKKPCVECASTDEGAMTLEEYIISKNWTIA